MRIVAALTLFICIAQPAFSQSREDNGAVRHAPGTALTDQVIIKWRNGAAAGTSTGAQKTSAEQKISSKLQKFRGATGLQFQRKGRIGTDVEVLQLDRQPTSSELDSVLKTLAADPDVEYASPDERRWAHAVPNDPLYAQQWYAQATQPSATHAEQAWDVTVGSNTTIVAVIDTGVRFEHPDLGRVAQGGKLLPGYDFIANATFANDGDGRDSDAADPGDWVTQSELQQAPFAGNCGTDPRDSSWHGTRVSSLIGALTQNGEGIAGTSWNTLILPARVLGKCGGTDSDIIAAMRWAAGIDVVGVPHNATPANIINMSLGGPGQCTAAEQAAVNEIIARGVVIVASVGNEGTSVGAPANCTGVIGVSGLRHAGTKVGFSSLGPGADIGAPAGNCVNTGPPCLFSIVVAVNGGTTVPGADTYTDQMNFNVGTSFSAPQVAGAVALLHAVNSHLTPAQYLTVLQASASPFPTSSSTTTTTCHVPAGDTQKEECICTTQTCGAGMLNTQAAVLAAQQPLAVISASTSIGVNASVTIDGRGSFAANNRTLTTFQWSALNVTGATPVFADASQALTTLQVSSSSTFTLRLTITDDQGAQDTADLAMATTTLPSTPSSPTAPTRSGGGGGSFDWQLLALCFVLLAASRVATYRAWRRARPGTR